MSDLIFKKMREEGVYESLITRIRENIEEDGVEDLIYLWLEYPLDRNDILADLQEVIDDCFGNDIISQNAPKNSSIGWFADCHTKITSLFRSKIEQIGERVVASRLEVPIEYINRVKNYYIPSGDMFDRLMEITGTKEEIEIIFK